MAPFFLPSEDELEEFHANLALGAGRDDNSSMSGSMHQDFELNSSDEGEKLPDGQGRLDVSTSFLW